MAQSTTTPSAITSSMARSFSAWARVMVFRGDSSRSRFQIFS
jgi:hypothetical protein